MTSIRGDGQGWQFLLPPSREFTLVSERVASLRLRVGRRILTVICAQVPKHQLELKSLEGVLENGPPGDSFVLRDFSALVGSNSETWRGVVRNIGPPDLNCVLLLDLCACHGLSITNTMFRHKGVHMCTWH